MKNLFNPSQPLPKKFMMYTVNMEYICTIENNTHLVCVLSTGQMHEYRYDIDDIMHFFASGQWIITEIINQHSIENDFSNCYIDVEAFAEANNIQLETAHYIIQPWLFSLGKDWGSHHKQTIFYAKAKMLVFEGNRICWEDVDYKEERDELCLNYSPVSGISYVIVPFVKPKTKRTGWVNVYKHSYSTDISTGSIHNTKEEAIEKAGKVNHLVDTVEINWEE